MNSYFDFTSDEIFGKQGTEEDCTYEENETLEEFIDKTCKIITSGNNGFPIVINMGCLILFFVFDENPRDNPDTKLKDAYLALSLFDREFVMVPSAIGDWIIGQYLNQIEGMDGIFEEDDIDSDEDFLL